MTNQHASDCAVHNEPAYPAGPCDCHLSIESRLDQMIKHAYQGSTEAADEIRQELVERYKAMQPAKMQPCAGRNCGSTDPNLHSAECFEDYEKATGMNRQEPVASSASWFALVMNAAAELEDASHCLRDEDAKRVANSGAKYYRDAAKALYTAPPQRELQSLTDEEITALKHNGERYISSQDFARAIEAKLKEKNNG